MVFIDDTASEDARAANLWLIKMPYLHLLHFLSAKKYFVQVEPDVVAALRLLHYLLLLDLILLSVFPLLRYFVEDDRWLNYTFGIAIVVIFNRYELGLNEAVSLCPQKLCVWLQNEKYQVSLVNCLDRLNLKLVSAANRDYLLFIEINFNFFDLIRLILTAENEGAAHFLCQIHFEVSFLKIIFYVEPLSTHFCML